MIVDFSKKEPTLEMRLAAIEDKLARLTVPEEEMRAYSKVADLARVAARRPAEGERCPRGWCSIPKTVGSYQAVISIPS